VNLVGELADERVVQEADELVALTVARKAMKWGTEQAVRKAVRKEQLTVGPWETLMVDNLVVRRDVPKVALTVMQLVAKMEFHLAWMMVDAMAGMRVARLVASKASKLVDLMASKLDELWAAPLVAWMVLHSAVMLAVTKAANSVDVWAGQWGVLLAAERVEKMASRTVSMTGDGRAQLSVATTDCGLVLPLVVTRACALVSMMVSLKVWPLAVSLGGGLVETMDMRSEASWASKRVDEKVVKLEMRQVDSKVDSLEAELVSMKAAPSVAWLAVLKVDSTADVMAAKTDCEKAKWMVVM